MAIKKDQKSSEPMEFSPAPVWLDVVGVFSLEATFPNWDELGLVAPPTSRGMLQNELRDAYRLLMGSASDQLSVDYSPERVRQVVERCLRHCEDISGRRVAEDIVSLSKILALSSDADQSSLAILWSITLQICYKWPASAEWLDNSTLSAIQAVCKSVQEESENVCTEIANRLSLNRCEWDRSVLGHLESLAPDHIENQVAALLANGGFRKFWRSVQRTVPESEVALLVDLYVERVASIHADMAAKVRDDLS